MVEQFYISKLELHNFRQFSDKVIQLDKRMNLLIGSNSSGKTTVLEAACVSMGAYLAAYKNYVPSRFVQNLSDTDVLRKSQGPVRKDILLKPAIEQYPCYVKTELNMGTEKPKNYKRILEKEDGRTKFDGNNPMQKRVIEWEALIKQGNGSDQNIILPLVLYLSSARLWNENNNSEVNYEIPKRTDAYNRCLNKKRGMQMAFNYIRHMVEIANQEKGGEEFPAYTLIMNAIKKSMEDELPEGDTIEYSLRYKGLALVRKDGTWIPFDGLSDGYRGVIKIVADIAARMCILNPYLKEHTLEDTPGVVMIDELDLSLHPSWQRRIVNTLTTLFPKVQFICASHSPFIIQSLESGLLISMEGEVEDEYAGQSIEDIAEDIMGVENPQYSDRRNQMYEWSREYFAKLEASKTMKEVETLKNELEALTARFGDNPAYYAFMRQKYLERKLEME